MAQPCRDAAKMAALLAAYAGPPNLRREARQIGARTLDPDAVSRLPERPAAARPTRKTYKALCAVAAGLEGITTHNTA